MKQPWDRLKQETSKAFHAFNLYLMLGVTRNANGVIAQTGKCRNTVERWSARHNWVERARLYDEHIEVEKRLAQEKADIEFITKERREWRLKQLQTGKAFYGVAGMALTHLKERTHEISATEACKMAETGSGQVARAFGDPDAVQEHRGGSVGAVIMPPEYAQFLMDWAKPQNGENENESE